VERFGDIVEGRKLEGISPRGEGIYGGNGGVVEF